MPKYHSFPINLGAIVGRAKLYAAELAWRIKRNPVLVGTAALATADSLNSGHPLTWRTAVVAGVGFLVRSKVVPAHEVTELRQFAQDVVDGVFDGVFDAVDEGVRAGE